MYVSFSYLLNRKEDEPKLLAEWPTKMKINQRFIKEINSYRFTGLILSRSLCRNPTSNPFKSVAAHGSNQNELDDVIELECDDLYDSDRKEVLLLKKPTHNIKLIMTVQGKTNAFLVYYNSSFMYGSNQTVGEFLSCVDRPYLELPVTPNTTYTFCVLTSPDKDEISPLNFVSHYVKPNWSRLDYKWRKSFGLWNCILFHSTSYRFGFLHWHFFDSQKSTPIQSAQPDWQHKWIQ